MKKNLLGHGRIMWNMDTIDYVDWNPFSDRLPTFRISRFVYHPNITRGNLKPCLGDFVRHPKYGFCLVVSVSKKGWLTCESCTGSRYLQETFDGLFFWRAS